MTEFEFQESDVIFGDGDQREGDRHSRLWPRVLSNKPGKNKKMPESGSNSPPVSIPLFLRLRDFEDHCDDEDEGEMVPPHVIVDRRWSDGRAAFSVCFSNGRTLKGRCLSEVRNSILRMTGFLES